MRATDDGGGTASAGLQNKRAADLGRVFDYIDAHREDALKRLADYVARPSISDRATEVAATAGYLKEVISKIGMDVEVISTAGNPVVVAERRRRPERPTVLIYGHYDVQPPDPIERWTTPPFEPAVRDGRIFGRGTADNKGQHLAHLLGIEALLACDQELPCNVVVLLDGEEEAGSPNLAGFVAENRERLACDLVVWSDGPVHSSGRSCVLFGVRGMIAFDLRASGANRTLHSGNWGGVAPNPLWTLVHLLASMKSSSGAITIDGLSDDVVAPTQAERAALEALPGDIEATKRDLGVGHLDEPAERGLAERLAAWPTFTINGLHGGYGGAGSQTSLPHEAVAKCDIRLVEAQSTAGAWAAIEAHVGRVAPEVELIRRGAMEPSKTPLEHPLARPVAKAVAVAQGREPLLVPALGGSLPDYVWTKVLGVPSFGIPFANVDEANHAPDENLDLEHFFLGVKTAASLLAHIGDER